MCSKVLFGMYFYFIEIEWVLNDFEIVLSFDVNGWLDIYIRFIKFWSLFYVWNEF